jgi:hypothetical protein
MPVKACGDEHSSKALPCACPSNLDNLILVYHRQGVFATRTPHRPNAIGLSLCRLEGIEGNVVHFSSVDIIHVSVCASLVFVSMLPAFALPFAHKYTHIP